jgi:hypothetical protein
MSLFVHSVQQLKQVNIIRKLKTSRWRFDQLRRSYFSQHPMSLPPVTSDPALASLCKDGFVLLTNYWDKNLIKQIHDKALPIAERCRHGEVFLENATVRYPKDGIYRVQSIDSVIPEVSVLVNDKRLMDIVGRYLGTFTYRTNLNYLDYKPDVGRHDYTTVPHMDTWRSQIKIFTLLVDVKNDTAPLVYWKGSHRDRPWRRDLDYLNFTGSLLGSTGTMPPAIVRAQEYLEDDPLQEVTLTAPAGSVIIADVRGAHRASNLYSGYRLELVQKINPTIKS